MTDIMTGTGLRPFSVAACAPDEAWRIINFRGLIMACEVTHLGHMQDTPFLPATEHLAKWLMENAHRDLGAIAPFDDGALIERILAGLVSPSEELATAIEAATGGALRSSIWTDADIARPNRARPNRHSLKTTPAAVGIAPVPIAAAGAEEPSPASSSPFAGRAAVPSTSPDLPQVGVLGGPLPAGRVCVPIADGRVPGGFVLTFSAGVSIALDEGMALAARDAIDAGIAHIRAARADGRRIAA